jgi:hypothetical protein
VKQLEMFGTHFEQAQADLEEAVKEFDIAGRKVQEARRLRDELCPHKEIYAHKEYHEGGYSHTAYTLYKNVCKCCKKQIGETTRVDHGWYS